jgi:hypothetical protein
MAIEQQSYTEVLVRQTKTGAKTIWTPQALRMDVKAFQHIVARLDELAEAGLVRVIDKDRESDAGQRPVYQVRFQRLRK